MIFLPNSNDELSQLLRDRSNSPLHISGNAIDREGIQSISTARMNSVLFYEPEEMIIAVQAGISLDVLQKTLAEKGQWIPALVASELSGQTLGAAVALDHFHPRSLNCGALRTSILGGTFCTTGGEIFKSGSRVVKSVAGYDIHRAFCGSQGRFGIIVDLTIKVQPLPEIFYRFLAPLESKKRLLQVHPFCLENFDEQLVVELAGYKEDLKYDLEEIKSVGIVIKELGDTDWSLIIKKLIRSRNENRGNTSLSNEAKKILDEVKHTFDPEGVLN